MPTVIALDVSLSMLRNIPGRIDDNNLTYYQLAVKGINQFLDQLSQNSRLEFVSLITYSSKTEIIIDFTRDYDLIRHAVKKVEHCDKINLDGMLRAVSTILKSNWGRQNYCQTLVFTNCGIGFGSTSLKHSLENFLKHKDDLDYPFLTTPSKFNFICIGLVNDVNFMAATELYQKYLETISLQSQLFLPKSKEELNEESKSGPISKSELGKTAMSELIDRMCDTCYKQFEVTLKCGEYFRLECQILIWPPPLPYVSQDVFGKDIVRVISRKIEICGYIPLSDIGSPVSVSRHLIVAKVDLEKSFKKGSKSQSKNEHPQPTNEYEKIDLEIRNFLSKSDGDEDENAKGSGSNLTSSKDSMCVLLHGALKVENMAALVLLGDDWYGFIHSYADSKKKSNLMINILPPGSNVIPWLGNLQLLVTPDENTTETLSFPVKSEKRSYSQSSVVWIKEASLQSDIHKVLRHAKKLPEKTPHFYKEMNRIRRAALSIGFVELLETLADIFESEITVLPQNASPDCSIQLKHAANELRKLSKRDLKQLISAKPTKYNQL